MSLLPLLIEAEDLIPELNNPAVLVLDLGSFERYQQAHIPNAIYLPPKLLMCNIPPAMGKLPSREQLEQLFSQVGLSPLKHVVVYDDEGGGWAGRLIWTLDVIGHKNYSALNGGMVAWMSENQPLTNEVSNITPTDYKITAFNTDVIATRDDIIANLQNPKRVIWDARSADEYTGKKMLAQKAGHIPGAVNFEWTQAMDRTKNLRIKDHAALTQALAAIGISADKEIVTHCQSHHRSAFTYMLAKILGFTHVKGYDGSWSEWGNDPNTPVEL